MRDERPFEEDATLEDLAPSVDGPAEPAGTTGVPVEPDASAIGRLRDQLADATERHLRLAAEFDNFRKRIARERVELADRAQAAFVMRLLEVLDDLDRVVGAESVAPGDAVREAVALVDRKLRKELEAAGLERIDPAGRKFDPAEAEAVAVLPPPTPEQDHLVATTFQVGYRFKGSLVRPARVQVFSGEGHA